MQILHGRLVTLTRGTAIVAKPHTQVVARTAGRRIVIPPLVAAAGEHALRRFLEFFAATISSKNTRTAYYRAVCHFFAWLGQHGIDELVGIEPLHARPISNNSSTPWPSRP